MYDTFVLQKVSCFFIDKFHTIISPYCFYGDIELIFYQGCEGFYGLEGVTFTTDKLSPCCPAIIINYCDEIFVIVICWCMVRSP